MTTPNDLKAIEVTVMLPVRLWQSVQHVAAARNQPVAALIHDLLEFAYGDMPTHTGSA